MRTMRRGNAAWLAAPAVGYLAVLFIGPASVVLAYSLMRRDIHGGVLGQFSWDAWRMATDGITLRVLFRTLLLAAAVTGETAVAVPSTADGPGPGSARRSRASLATGSADPPTVTPHQSRMASRATSCTATSTAWW